MFGACTCVRLPHLPIVMRRRQIETDKASMDLDSQEDGFLAKILMPAGSQDLAIGYPIAIVVRNELFL